MCGTPDKVSGRWSNDNYVGLTREADVIESVTGTKDFRVDRSARDCFECDWADELARAASHYYVDLSPGLCKQTRQPH